jgi:hypothetical protein
MSERKKLTNFQKRVVLAVQNHAARDIIVNGMTIASIVFRDTWKKNPQSHGRLVGRIGQEVWRLDLAQYLNYHGARDQWGTFGASLRRKRFVCSNCKNEFEGALHDLSEYHCFSCHRNRRFNTELFAQMTDFYFQNKETAK